MEKLSGTIFIHSFTRFTARRGLPSVINTDNAKTFKYTAGYLGRLKMTIFYDVLQEKRIPLKFNLEGSPESGARPIEYAQAAH